MKKLAVLLSVGLVLGCIVAPSQPAPDIGSSCSSDQGPWNAPEVYSGPDGNGNNVNLCRNAQRSCVNGAVVQSPEKPADNESQIGQSCDTGKTYQCVVSADYVASVVCQ